ncbi:MAG: hypothetical protein LC768_08655, partial [Acidobacteria bacterium]|nr:hypothetical protein [Acidobacteriota bacterium]MCA1638388.1 hypothetical protein [Acidobacteriota bacterium]
NETTPKLLIGFFYPRLYPKWKEAKDCYEKNKKFSNWRKIVATAFEEDKLPSDLIERFDETSPDFDPYAAMPSTIALEHAARMCDVDVESVGLRTLQNYLKESREWIERVGEKKAEEEVGKRIAHAIEDITMMFRVAYQMGTRPPIDRLSFFQRQILVDGFEEDLMNAIKKFEDQRTSSENEGETYLH